jgi:sugar phosphate isomerase/epimerase
MRISVFPKGELDDLVEGRLSLFDWITTAATLPIEGLELYSRFFTGQDQSFTERVGTALAEVSLDLPMMCASPDFTHPDRDVRAQEHEDQLRIMHIARELGGPGVSVRVLSGQRHPGVALEQGLDWATEHIESLIPVARELDVILAIENHYKDGFWTYPEFAQHPEVFSTLIGRIDERVHFGVQFDPSNAITAGTDAVTLLGEVIERVVTMQASDRHLAPGADLDRLRQSDGTIGYAPELRHGVIGQGLNDYPTIFSMLAAAGYDGWVSIEDGVNGMHEMRASVAFLREARERYFGGSTAVHVAHHEQARRALRDLDGRAPAQDPAEGP